MPSLQAAQDWTQSYCHYFTQCLMLKCMEINASEVPIDGLLILNYIVLSHTNQSDKLYNGKGITFIWEMGAHVHSRAEGKAEHVLHSPCVLSAVLSMSKAESLAEALLAPRMPPSSCSAPHLCGCINSHILCRQGTFALRCFPGIISMGHQYPVPVAAAFALL